MYQKCKHNLFIKEDISREQAVSIIMASASCFPAFPMMDIDGQKYIDGGYADNVPISLIKEMNADKIIVIDVMDRDEIYDKSK